MKKILITGGAGFIGSHLADELLSQGYQVRILDSLSTGRFDNIRHLEHEPTFDLIDADVTDPPSGKLTRSGSTPACAARPCIVSV